MERANTKHEWSFEFNILAARSFDFAPSLRTRDAIDIASAV